MEIIKMLGVWGALLFVVFLATPITPTTAARQPEYIKVILNEHAAIDVPLKVIDGQLMLPMRSIFEALGMEISWVAESQTVIAENENVTITMTINYTAITVNDEIVLLDVAPQIVNLRMLVPVQVLEKSLNAVIEWGYEMSVITITTNEQVAVPEPFVLTISVEEATLPQGEAFSVDVKLENNSGEDHVLYYSLFFIPSIPGWHPFGGVAIDLPEYRPVSFEADSALRRRLGIMNPLEPNMFSEHRITLEPGEHELRVRASFVLNLGQDNSQRIRLWSNTVKLTVQYCA